MPLTPKKVYGAAVNEAKNYTDSVALSGVPVNYPRVVSGKWQVFNPVSNSYADTGIYARGTKISINSGGNWQISEDDGATWTDTGVKAQGYSCKFRATATNIEWCVDDGSDNWQTLTPLSALKGDKGDDGFSPTITVNTDTSEAYNLDITSESGTITTPNLKGEKGETGAKGDDGEQGIPGQNGADGVVQSIVVGNNITVDNTNPASPVISSNAGIPEAPSDDKIYGRKNGAWTEVSGDTPVSDIDDNSFNSDFPDFDDDTFDSDAPTIDDNLLGSTPPTASEIFYDKTRDTSAAYQLNPLTSGNVQAATDELTERQNETQETVETLVGMAISHYQPFPSINIGANNYKNVYVGEDANGEPVNILRTASSTKNGADYSGPMSFVLKQDLTAANALNEKLANKTTTLSSASTTEQYPSAKTTYNYIQNVIATIPAGGLKIPIELDEESNLPTTGMVDGDYYFIQDMDITAAGHTGRAWWNSGWHRVYDEYQSMDGISIVQTSNGKWQVSTTWLGGVISDSIANIVGDINDILDQINGEVA